MGQRQQEALEAVRARQEALVAELPALREELRTERASLAELEISEAAYNQLAGMREDDRSLREHVAVRVHEACAPHKQRAERLQREVEELRASLASATRQHERRRREAEAEAAAQRDRADTTERRASAAEAHAKEALEEARAKGAEVEGMRADHRRAQDGLRAAKAVEDALAREREHASVLATQLGAVRAEKDEAVKESRAAREREGLLQRDKAHLEKEVAAAQHGQRRAEEDLDREVRRREEVEAARESLAQQLAKAQEEGRSGYETRLRDEVARLRDEGQRELREIRATSQDVYARENATLRDAREEARAGLERAEARAREAEREAERAREEGREAAARRDTVITDLRAQVRVKAYEGERSATVAEELRAALDAANGDVQELREKVDVLRGEYAALEARAAGREAQLGAEVETTRARLRAYEEVEAEVDRAIVEGGQVPEEAAQRASAELAALARGAPTPAHHRIQQAVLLARRATRAEDELKRCRKALNEAEERAKEAEERAAQAEERAGSASQPHSYLIDALRTRESEAREAQRRAKQAESALATEREALRRAEAEAEEAVAQAAALQSLRGELAALRTQWAPAAADRAWESQSPDHAAPAAATAAVASTPAPGSQARRPGTGDRAPTPATQPATQGKVEGQEEVAAAEQGEWPVAPQSAAAVLSASWDPAREEGPDAPIAAATPARGLGGGEERVVPATGTPKWHRSLTIQGEGSM